MDLCQEPKCFSELFSAFYESALKFGKFQKNMSVTAYVFPKLPTTKDVLR